MANNYFAFKQFTVWQDKTAMKVTTEGCLFGAWVASQIIDNPTETWLDIGAGTGLLSLMLAQKNADARIHALEIDSAAAAQCADNLEKSPFIDRLKTIQADVLQWKPDTLYDQIITNPPFYQHQLQSPDEARKMAHHDTGLTLDDLFASINCLLKPTGSFYLLLPASRAEAAKKMALQLGWHCNTEILVHQTEKHAPFRSMMRFSQTATNGVSQHLTIKKENAYTPEFISLLQDYYLYL